MILPLAFVFNPFDAEYVPGRRMKAEKMSSHLSSRLCLESEPD